MMPAPSPGVSRSSSSSSSNVVACRKGVSTQLEAPSRNCTRRGGLKGAHQALRSPQWTRVDRSPPPWRRARPQSVICHLSSVISLCPAVVAVGITRLCSQCNLHENSGVSIALLGVRTQCHFCKMLITNKLKLRLKNCLSDDL